jgi:hypothetical protein
MRRRPLDEHPLVTAGRELERSLKRLELALHAVGGAAAYDRCREVIDNELSLRLEPAPRAAPTLILIR